MTTAKKVFVKTFGCQMNEYDSDKMADVLNISDGLVKTDTPDVILGAAARVREQSRKRKRRSGKHRRTEPKA